MQSIFSNALSEAVAKHIDLSATRRETLSWLALLIMQHGTICLWRLAVYVASVAQTDSVRRRFYRFFQFVQLDSTLAAHLVVELLGFGGKPWVLAIDRTNWDFGKTTINILMISVTWNGMGIPPFLFSRDCRRGASSPATSRRAGWSRLGVDGRGSTLGALPPVFQVTKRGIRPSASRKISW